jgi:hypothetical protein
MEVARPRLAESPFGRFAPVWVRGHRC